MKKIFIKYILLLFILIFVFIAKEAQADINLTIRDGSSIVFNGSVPPNTSGTIILNDSEGNPHPVDSKSVLSLINDADILSSNFEISNLTYYSSYGSLYLKCITDTIGNQCDNWQYTVNDTYPSVGMDSMILSGDENVYLYFGPQYRITINPSNINSNEPFTGKAESYNYKGNNWIPRNGVTVGVTKPDPSNPWSPIEITTKIVNEQGEATFLGIEEGDYNIGVKEDYYFPTEILKVTQPPSVSGCGNCGATIVIQEEKKKFDTINALNFLVSKQEINGSFSNNLYTDWATIALASDNGYQKEKEKIKEHFSLISIKDWSLTDYERHTMALMSLGINPYDFNKINYIENITKEFDEKQFGDPFYVNDDIFALIVLWNAGFTKDETIIKNTVNYILTKQEKDGSWGGSVDITGAAIVALAKNKEDDNIKKSLEKAKEYILKNKRENGSFANNVSSTAWALEGLLTLDNTYDSTEQSDYFAQNQEVDGGIKEVDINSKLWSTSYAASISEGKTWYQIMHKFEKPNNTNTIEVKNKEEKKLEIKNTPTIEKKNSKNINTKNTKQNLATEKLAPEKDLQTKKSWWKKILWIFGI